MTGFLTGLLELTLTTGVLIILLLLLTPVLEKRFPPRWRYWAWLVLALRLAIPFNLSLPEPLIILPSPVLAEQAGPSSADMLQELEPELPAESVQPLPAGTANGVYAGNYQTPFVHSSQVVMVNGGQVTVNWLRQAIQWPNVLFALWAAGGLTALGWHLFQHRSFLRLCRRWKRPASPAEQAEADRRAEALGIGRHPALYRCAAVSTPMLTGLLHPVILLPLGLKGEALSVALDHELRHAQRHDLWYKALLLWVRCLHWFNPLAWLMCRRAEGDLEQCCDHDLLRNRSLADRRAYGALLLDQMTAGQKGGTRLTTGFSGSRREVLARFKALLDTSVKKNGRAALAAVAAAALLGGGLVACQNAAYDQGAQQYRDPLRNFQVDIPQDIWDQLEVVQQGGKSDGTVSFVSRTVKELLTDFDVEEDYWLQFLLRKSSAAVKLGSVDTVRERCAAAGATEETLAELDLLYAAARSSMYSFQFLSKEENSFYNGATGVYQDNDIGFSLSVPEHVWDQLQVVSFMEKRDEFISFVSQEVMAALGDGFDPAEDYWLQVRRFHPEQGGTVRSVTYGEWETVRERCEAAGMEPSDGNALADLYAAAEDAYHSCIFSSGSDSGASTEPVEEAYYEDAGVYLNFALGFGLEIPREIYEQLIVVSDQRRNSGSSVIFLDRRLVDELGWDTDIMLTNRNVFLIVSESSHQDGLQVSAGESGTLENHPDFRAADQSLREAVLEMAGQAEGVASTLFDLSAVEDGLAEGDRYDPRSLYSYRAKDDRVWIAIPGWAMAQIRTSYDGDRLTFSTLAGDPLLYWEGEGFTLPNLTTSSLSDPSADGAIAYMDLQDALLAAEWTTGGQTISLGTAVMDSTAACPDGTYLAELGNVSLNGDASRLLFTPEGKTGSYYLPLAADAELVPMFGPPEGDEISPEWVITSGMFSSAYPHLEVTVQNNLIVSFACVLGDGPLAE